MVGKLKDKEDAGARGKSYEIAFAKCMTLAGLEFEENGLRGASGALYDFKPKGLGWQKVPDGVPINLKVSTARTLFTSTDFWRQVFLKPSISTMTDAQVERMISKALNKVGFAKVYWLKAKSKQVEQAVMTAAKTNDEKLARLVLKEVNWSAHKPKQIKIDWVTDDDDKIQKVFVYGDGKKWATIAVRVNKRARNTSGWARTTSGTPKKPYHALTK